MNFEKKVRIIDTKYGTKEFPLRTVLCLGVRLPAEKRRRTPDRTVGQSHVPHLCLGRGGHGDTRGKALGVHLRYQPGDLQGVALSQPVVLTTTNNLFIIGGKLFKSFCL